MKNILLAAAVCIVMCCGTRKSETIISEVKTNTDLALQNNTKAELQNNAGSTSEGQKVEGATTATQKQSERMRPVNPHKPMKKTDPDGKTTIYENAILESGNEDTQHQEYSKEQFNKRDTFMGSISLNSKTDLKAQGSGTTFDKGKTTNRESISWVYILIIVTGLAIGLFIAWYRSKKQNRNEDV